jgi:Ca2+-binding RTX toxin-like protein
MRLANHLNRFHKYLRRQPHMQRLRTLQSRPRLEQLEDRQLLSTLFVDASGNAHYFGSPGIANNVTLSEKPLILGPSSSSTSASLPLVFVDVLTDTAETIHVTGPGASLVGGNGTHEVIGRFKSLQVDLFDGNEVINVHAIDYPATLRHDGPGTATVNVGAAGRLQGIAGSVATEAVGVGSSIHLNVDDSADPGHTVILGPNTVQFLGVAPPITFLGGATSVDVFGDNNDTYFEQTLSSTTPLTVHGLGGSTLVSGPGINDWLITGPNVGTLRNISFFSIQNLRGGPASLGDTFQFKDKAGVTGSIAGNPGSVTTLDYSQYTTLVTVDLKLNLALAGGFTTQVANIRNVLGGQGNNILVGDSNTNLLRGGSGRDILISGGGSNTVLQAGSGEAILLGAHFVFDTNLTALNAIMAEWSHTYDPINPLHDYQIRVSHLEHGGGLNGPFLINPATVVVQPGVTRLNGGAPFDFFITDPGDILGRPPLPGKEVVLFV